jgi:general secretion pathway protein G
MPGRPKTDPHCALPAPGRQGSHAGFTLLELIIACGLMMILATAAMPIARFTVMRQKEAQLRGNLHEIREAIDRYKDAADRNLIRVAAGTEGYPPDLETLVQGVEIVSQGANGLGTPPPARPGAIGTPPATNPLSSSGSGSGDDEASHRVRFLRRIPQDPMTGSADWGLRSVQDDFDSGSWGGKDVFDVYSKSRSTAMDGTRYSEW